jgi:hypothetical protein
LSVVSCQRNKAAGEVPTTKQAPHRPGTAPALGPRAAEFLARCVPLAEKDGQLTQQQRRTVAQPYADQAVAWLREAVAKGCKDTGQLTKPEAFDPLPGRADFQELVRTLEEKAKMK